MTQSIALHVLDDFPFELDLPALMKQLRIKEGSANHTEFQRLVTQATSMARPRALLLETYVTARSENWVEIEGLRFNSRVLSVNLEQAHRVFPFLATCGVELEEWADELSRTCDDPLMDYWAEAIKVSALHAAMSALDVYRERRVHPGKTAAMNPGSLEDWPLQQQAVLFALFDAANASIGVRLTESLLMVPTKSVSGICYPTEVDFASCLLCPRDACPNRRAPYDPDLYTSRYCAGAA